MRSRRWWLNHRDFFKGLVVALFTALGTLLQSELTLNSQFDLALLRRIAMASLIAFLAYLVKNILENSEGEFKPDAKK